jgi:hypothetical protein
MMKLVYIRHTPSWMCRVIDMSAPTEKNKKVKGFDSCTTPSQQLHNNPSYEGGS